MRASDRDGEYPAIYYQTIADLGIDPVVCGPFGEGLVSIGAEGCEESGTADGVGVGVSGRHRPAQLAAKALAKASEGSARAPRKRAPRKATAATAEAVAEKGAGANTAAAAVVPVTKAVKRANARVPSQSAVKTARGTAKVASSE